MKCSKCGKEIPVDTPPSENWQYYCPKCGLEEAMKEIKASKEYYQDIEKESLVEKIATIIGSVAGMKKAREILLLTRNEIKAVPNWNESVNAERMRSDILKLFDKEAKDGQD